MAINGMNQGTGLLADYLRQDFQPDHGPLLTEQLDEGWHRVLIRPPLSRQFPDNLFQFNTASPEAAISFGLPPFALPPTPFFNVYPPDFGEFPDVPDVADFPVADPGESGDIYIFIPGGQTNPDDDEAGPFPPPRWGRFPWGWPRDPDGNGDSSGPGTISPSSPSSPPTIIVS